MGYATAQYRHRSVLLSLCACKLSRAPTFLSLSLSLSLLISISLISWRIWAFLSYFLLYIHMPWRIFELYTKARACVYGDTDYNNETKKSCFSSSRSFFSLITYSGHWSFFVTVAYGVWYKEIKKVNSLMIEIIITMGMGNKPIWFLKI